MKNNKGVAATLLLVFAAGIVLWLAAERCYALEREACFAQLTEFTEQIGSEIKNTYLENQTYLEQVAYLFANEDLQDTEHIGFELAVLKNIGMISRMELLLPGDQLLTENGNIQNVSGILSFTEAAEAGSSISRRAPDLVYPDKLMLRQCVPVKQNDKVIAILCGVIDLSELPQLFSVNGYGDEAQLYIVEGKTGNFLQDSWHHRLGSVAELGARQTKAGYSWDAFLTSLLNGEKSSIVFRSHTTGAYFYAYSEPVGVEDWMVMVNVPEDTVYAQARQILGFYYISAVLLIVVFAVYFIWMLWNMRRDKACSENQLQVVRYMLEVEKELFGAHVNPNRFITALQKVADFLTAEVAFCWLIDGVSDIDCRLWSSKDGQLQKDFFDCSVVMPELFQILQEKGIILSDQIDALINEYPTGGKFLTKYQIQNLMLVPVTGLNGEITFILGACNMKHLWENAEPLQQVGLSFSVAWNYYNAHASLKRMGRMDGLTGLMNQNSYHAALDVLANNMPDMLGCVYMDVNGLHEMNNQIGHQAGDAMLIAVADALRDYFPQDDLYRIGGDEFVVLSKNPDEDVIKTQSEKVRADLKEQNYDISVGIAHKKKGDTVQEMIEDAEAAMQEDKRFFYRNGGKDRRARSLNKQIERMFLEKQDADTFLSVLAPEFKGVYFVKLETDSMRHLYIPSYFEEILQEINDVFSEALLLYAERLVKPSYYHCFEQVCDYDRLGDQFCRGIVPEFVYQKADGSWMKLRILKFKDYFKNGSETLWIFTSIDEPKEATQGQ